MTSKKKQRLYIWALCLLVSLFASSVVLVYQYLTDNFLEAGAASNYDLLLENIPEEETDFFNKSEKKNSGY